MVHKILSVSLLCLFFIGQNNLAAQITTEEIAAVKTFEGTSPMPFEAPDMNNTKQFLPDYKGKTVVLYFWDTKSKHCVGQLNALEKINREFAKDKVVVLGVAEDDKKTVTTFLSAKQYNFPIVPNALELGNLAYGGDKMDGPRAFIIDKSGTIQKVLLHMGGETEMYNAVREQIVGIEN